MLQHCYFMEQVMHVQNRKISSCPIVSEDGKVKSMMCRNEDL